MLHQDHSNENLDENKKIDTILSPYYALLKEFLDAPDEKSKSTLLASSHKIMEKVFLDLGRSKIYDRIPYVMEKHMLGVKVIDADVKFDESKHIGFHFNSIIESNTARPIKTIPHKKDKIPDRSEIFEPFKQKVIKRKVNQLRGTLKDTIFSKKTSVTLWFNTQIFGYQYKAMVLYDLSLCHLSPNYIFTHNLVTNGKWWIKDSAAWPEVMLDKEAHKSITMSELKSYQIAQYNTGKASIQNEILAKIPLIAVLGTMAVLYENNQYKIPLAADKLNALLLNYIFRKMVLKKYTYLTELLVNLPIYIALPAKRKKLKEDSILTPKHYGVQPYSIKEQLEDIHEALTNSNKKISREILKSLLISVPLGEYKEIYSPHLLMYFENLPDMLLQLIDDGKYDSAINLLEMKPTIINNNETKFIYKLLIRSNIHGISPIETKKLIEIIDPTRKANIGKYIEELARTQNSQALNFILDYYPHYFVNSLSRSAYITYLARYNNFGFILKVLSLDSNWVDYTDVRGNTALIYAAKNISHGDEKNADAAVQFISDFHHKFSFLDMNYEKRNALMELIVSCSSVSYKNIQKILKVLLTCSRIETISEIFERNEALKLKENCFNTLCELLNASTIDTRIKLLSLYIQNLDAKMSESKSAGLNENFIAKAENNRHVMLIIEKLDEAKDIDKSLKITAVQAARQKIIDLIKTTQEPFDEPAYQFLLNTQESAPKGLFHVNLAKIYKTSTLPTPEQLNNILGLNKKLVISITEISADTVQVLLNPDEPRGALEAFIKDRLLKDIDDVSFFGFPTFHSRPQTFGFSLNAGQYNKFMEKIIKLNKFTDETLTQHLGTRSISGGGGYK